MFRQLGRVSFAVPTFCAFFGVGQGTFFMQLFGYVFVQDRLREFAAVRCAT